jgi:mitogen-activated protein kinase kinase
MDSAAQAMQRASINESSHPILQSSNSFTASPGSSSATTRARGRGGGVTAAGRRNKPGFRLSDMNPETGGGAIGAGLGAGRPSLAEARRGPSSFDTPFANFNRIVCVSFPAIMS